MSMISSTCGEILFLVVYISRHTIFGSGLLVVQGIFRVFLFFRVLLFLACIFSEGLYLASMVIVIPYHRNN
jgi:hypothetical protein